jgi:hypothetical protein
MSEAYLYTRRFGTWLHSRLQVTGCLYTERSVQCHMTFRDTVLLPSSGNLSFLYWQICPMSEAYLAHARFRVMVLLPSSGDWLSLYWQICPMPHDVSGNCFIAVFRWLIFILTDVYNVWGIFSTRKVSSDGFTPIFRWLVVFILTDLPNVTWRFGRLFYCRLQVICHLYTDRYVQYHMMIRETVLLPSSGDWLSLYWQICPMSHDVSGDYFIAVFRWLLIFILTDMSNVWGIFGTRKVSRYRWLVVITLRGLL